MTGADPLRILHLTDLHLRSEPDGELYGVRTNASFRAVLARAMADDDWQPDAVLVTGDIAEDPTPTVYANFRARMAPLGVPVLCLPGNHDDPAVMATSLNGGNVSLCASLSLGGWRIVLLDAFVAGEAGGTLGPAELQRLQGELAAAAGQWVLVAVHQQPLPMGSAWLDGVGLSNGGALLDALSRHDRARAVVWGHVHQASDRSRGHIRLLSTPSTCAQFTPHTERCVMDIRPPGFRQIELHPDGSLRTEVFWLEELVLTERPPDSRAQPEDTAR